MTPFKILLIKTGAFGDMVLSSASFITVRENFPAAGIYLLTRKCFSEIVEDCPVFDGIYYLEDSFPSDFCTVMLKIRRSSFDMVIDLQGNFSSNFFAFLSDAGERIGYYKSAAGGFLLTKKVRRGKIVNPVDGQYPVLEKAGMKKFRPGLKIWVSENKRKMFDAFVREMKIDTSKKWIVLHPLSAQGWLTRRWPWRKFAEVGDALAGRGYQIIFIGAGKEKNLAAKICESMKFVSVNLAGRTNFWQLSLLLEKSALLVTGDTGPLHIGAAAGTKVLGIFGPSDPAVHCPPGVCHIYKKFHCSPCHKKTCRDSGCMEDITVEEVLGKIRDMLV